MATIERLTENLKFYITSLLEAMSKDTPIINFMKPFIIRALNKNIGKATQFLELISDENNNIDIDNILTEMADSVITSNPFIIKIPIIGDMKLGGGFVKFNIPFTDKELVLGKDDLLILKETLLR